MAANALATGVLSGPQPRYQARIAWLLPMAGFLAWRPAVRVALNDKGPRPDGRGP